MNGNMNGEFQPSPVQTMGNTGGAVQQMHDGGMHGSMNGSMNGPMDGMDSPALNGSAYDLPPDNGMDSSQRSQITMSRMASLGRSKSAADRRKRKERREQTKSRQAQ